MFHVGLHMGQDPNEELDCCIIQQMFKRVLIFLFCLLFISIGHLERLSMESASPSLAIVAFTITDPLLPTSRIFSWWETGVDLFWCSSFLSWLAPNFSHRLRGQTDLSFEKLRNKTLKRVCWTRMRTLSPPSFLSNLRPKSFHTGSKRFLLLVGQRRFQTALKAPNFVCLVVLGSDPLLYHSIWPHKLAILCSAVLQYLTLQTRGKNNKIRISWQEATMRRSCLPEVVGKAERFCRSGFLQWPERPGLVFTVQSSSSLEL